MNEPALWARIRCTWSKDPECMVDDEIDAFEYAKHQELPTVPVPNSGNCHSNENRKHHHRNESDMCRLCMPIDAQTVIETPPADR